MRPQIVRAIIAAGIVNKKDTTCPIFNLTAALRANKMLLDFYP